MADDINTPVVPFPTPPLDSPTADPAVVPPTVPAVPPQIPVSVSQQPVQSDPPQEKKPAGKTSMIVGAVFLLIVFPIIGYYVSQKTNIMNNLPFADSGIAAGWQWQDSQGQWHVDNTVDKGDRGERAGNCTGPKSCPTGQSLRCNSRPSNNLMRPDICECLCIGATITPTFTITTTPTMTLTSTQTPTQTPSPTDSGRREPGNCDASCGSDSDCRSGMVCANADGVKRCRNPQCTGEFSCTCPAVVVLTATPRPIV